MSQIVQKEIDGVRFTCQKHAPLRSLRLKARLLKMLGPMLKSLAPMLKGTDATKLAEMSVERGAEVLGAIAAHLDPTQLPDLVAELLATVTAIAPNGAGVLAQHDFVSPATIDAFFADREVTLYKALWFAGATQFAGFFDGIRLSDPTPPAASPSS